MLQYYTDNHCDLLHIHDASACPIHSWVPICRNGRDWACIHRAYLRT